MRRVLKWAALTVGGLVLLVVLAGGWIYISTNGRLNRVYHLDPGALALRPGAMPGGQGAAPGPANVIPAGGVSHGGAEATNGNGGATDAPASNAMAARLAWGEHIVTTRGCADCHGEDLGGALFADAMPVFQVSSSNLTPAGVGGTYTDADWVRSIRHGIGPDGKPLLVMPSYEFYALGDDDLADVILYLKSLPPVERVTPPSQVGPMGRLLFFAGKLPILSAELIDHDAPHPPAPPRGATAEYGAYLASGCVGCHGDGLSGGPIPGTPPEWPPAGNITQDKETGLGNWTRDDFFAVMKTGRTPDGRTLQPQFMPWTNIGQLYDDELDALWLYLKGVEAKPAGGR